jgi:hypothetical protein
MLDKLYWLLTNPWLGFILLVVIVAIYAVRRYQEGEIISGREYRKAAEAERVRRTYERMHQEQARRRLHADPRYV